MHKAQVKAAQEIVRKGREQVPDKGVYRVLCEWASVGTVRGSKIHLNEQDRMTLDQMVSMELGHPLIEIDLDCDTRIDAAKQAANEKWSKGTVFGSLLNFTSLGDAIPLVTGEQSVCAGSVLSIPIRNIALERIRKLILVENGEVLLNADLLKHCLPETYHSALILYRGHGENQNAVKHLIQELAETAQLALFFDYDAAGMSMAKTYMEFRPCELLIPEDPAPLTVFSKRDEYNRQFPQLQALIQGGGVVGALAEDLLQRQLAVTQEHLMVNQTTFRRIAIIRKI